MVAKEGALSSLFRRHREHDVRGAGADGEGGADGGARAAQGAGDAAEAVSHDGGAGHGIGAPLDAMVPWHGHLTVRGLVLGAACALLFCTITLRLSLGPAGIVPSINAPAGLLSFLVLKAFSKGGQSLGFRRGAFKPLTVQETTVVQTYVTSACNVAFTGGFATWLTAMSYQTSQNIGGPKQDSPSYDAASVYDPTPKRVVPFVLLTSFTGIFAIIALRKLIILDWQLPFPSGTATGIMLNSFFSKSGEASAMRKIKVLLWSAGGSFAFELFKWFWAGADYSCGFSSWPMFGFEAFKWTFFFDWNQSYIGSGIICPHVVNWSMMLGAILSWGVLWPTLTRKEGDWYPAGLPKRDLKGLFGYKVFLTIAMAMGEGIYMLGSAAVTGARDAAARVSAARAARARGAGGGGAGGDSKDVLVGGGGGGSGEEGALLHLEAKSAAQPLLEFKESAEEREIRGAVFAAGSIPWWMSPAGYVATAALATGLVPLIYPPVKWYYLAVAFVICPMLALPNAYGCGLTDWDNAGLFGKIALFAFSGWAGSSGGIIAGLAMCGVVLACCSVAAVMMQGFRTGYVTTTSPRTMLAAQAIGTLMGVLLAPLAFFLIYATGQVGVKEGPYSNPFADIYRSMAILSAQGFGGMPKHCAALMGALFGGAMLVCALRDALPQRYARLVPSPMAISIPFYLGANNAINFWVGSLINHVWEWRDAPGADAYAQILGAGLLIGAGVFALPSSVLTLAGVAPPVCMSFSPQPPK